jgi:hypothetical protein
MVELQSETSLHTPRKRTLQIVEPSSKVSHTFPLKQVLSAKHCSFRSVVAMVASAEVRKELEEFKNSRLTSPRDYSTDSAVAIALHCTLQVWICYGRATVRDVAAYAS